MDDSWSSKSSAVRRILYKHWSTYIAIITNLQNLSKQKKAINPLELAGTELVEVLGGGDGFRTLRWGVSIEKPENMLKLAQELLV